ncbi:MAG: serine/threonine-protein kinase [Gemmataceae bacterium]
MLSIFCAALEQRSGDGRAAYLAEACGADTALRGRIDALLRAHASAGDFLEAEAASAEGPGTVIGPYTLRELIGEGGMGLVYVAEQERPVRRKVALKVVKPGLGGREVVARFEAERQALAMMDHPNIAKIFDAGAIGSDPASVEPSGRRDCDDRVGGDPRRAYASTLARPYFVMELVRGVPITDYCDANRLTTRRRLEMFLTVCGAVQHAHQKGIIHRDLKPSNVLVSVHDVTPVVKVIDFGVAKAAGQALTDKTLYTGFAQMVGTPLYMSPEQAGLSDLDVDTRSDIYSLGVLLYELLTGTTPFAGESLRQAGYDEMRRIIREDEPPVPSTRLATIQKDALSTVSERRGVDARKLSHEVRGDLDWVVMKALEKDRNRRYESASAFAQDIERYLADEPVVARPPSAAYRVRKFARRNRTALVAASAVVASLVAATGVSTWQAVKAGAAERRANSEAAIAQSVSDFLRYDLLRQVEKGHEDWWTEYPNLTVREALDRATARIGDRFQDQPLVEAAIRETIGDAYKGVGESPLAAVQLERSLALRRAVLGPDHPVTLGTMDRLGGAYDGLGRFHDAVALREEILERRQAKFGLQHEGTLNAMGGLVTPYRMVGQSDKALVMAQRVLEKRTLKFGSNHAGAIDDMRNVAACYMDLGRLDEALALFQKAFDLYRTPPEVDRGSPGLLLTSYARASVMAGKLEDAERLVREELEYAQKQEGIERRNGTAHAMSQIAAGNDRGRQGIKFRVQTAHAMSRLAAILLKQERFAEAESLARQAQEVYETTPIVHSGPSDFRTFYATSLLGGALLGQKRYGEAEPFLLKGYEGLKQREALIGQGDVLWHSPTDALLRVIRFYEETNQTEKAKEWREKLPSENPPGG